MSRQLRIRVVGLLVVLLSGLAMVGMVVPACGFSAENLKDVPSDAMLLFDAPPDIYIPDAAPCSSLIKTCVAGTVLRACQVTGQLPVETTCEWDCSEIPEPHCRVLVPMGNAVTSTDLDRTMAMAAGLQKKTFSTIASSGSINTDTGAITIGINSRMAGTGVKNGIDFQIRNGVGVFRFLELELNGFQDVRVTGVNALALVAIDKITIGDGTQVDLRGTCTGRNAGPGGKQGGGASGGGAGTGAGGAGDAIGGCSGGGGAGNGLGGASGGGKSNAGGTNAGVFTTIVGGAGGGGGGGGGGDGGGGGGAIQLVSNGPITINAAMFSTVGVNVGGCGGKVGTCSGGGAGAGGVILIEGRTVDLGGGYLAANGGGGGGGMSGTGGQAAQTTNRATGGNGVIQAGSDNDSGDGGDGADDGAGASNGGTRDGRGGGGGGGVGWIRINTKSGSMGQQNSLVTPTLGSPSASTGTATVQ